MAFAPFPAIANGDRVDPGSWPGRDPSRPMLRVVQVEHFAWETREARHHKVMAYTEKVEGTRESAVGDAESVAPPGPVLMATRAGKAS
jgi:hypothetical protein